MKSISENEGRDRRKQVLKYLIGIIICETIVLLVLINLGPDMELTRYGSVQVLLESIQSQTQQQHPDFLNAAAAIRRESNDIKFFGMIVFVGSIIVIGLSLLTLLKLRRCDIVKTQPADRDKPV